MQLLAHWTFNTFDSFFNHFYWKSSRVERICTKYNIGSASNSSHSILSTIDQPPFFSLRLCTFQSCPERAKLKHLIGLTTRGVTNLHSASIIIALNCGASFFISVHSILWLSCLWKTTAKLALNNIITNMHDQYMRRMHLSISCWLCRSVIAAIRHAVA